MSKRKQHSPEFKAKVARGALTDEETPAELGVGSGFTDLPMRRALLCLVAHMDWHTCRLCP